MQACLSSSNKNLIHSGHKWLSTCYFTMCNLGSYAK